MKWYVQIPFANKSFEPETEKAFVLTYEDPLMYGRSLISLQNTFDNEDVEHVFQFFDKTDSPISSSKMLFVPDLLTFDFNTTHISTALKKHLTKLKANNVEKWSKIERQALELNTISEEFIQESDLPLTLTASWDIASWIKACGIKIKWQPDGSLLEKAEQILQVNLTLQLADIIVFAGINQYLDDHALSEFYRYSVELGQSIMVVQHSAGRKESEMAYVHNVFVTDALDTFEYPENTQQMAKTANCSFVEVLG